MTATCTCGQQPHRLICDLVLGRMTDDQPETTPPTSDPEKD